jgi:hypothetical protein
MTLNHNASTEEMNSSQLHLPTFHMLKDRLADAVASPLPTFLFWIVIWIVTGVALAFLPYETWKWIESVFLPQAQGIVSMFIFPALIGIGIVHCVTTLVGPKNALIGVLVGIPSGFLGVGILYESIERSPDPAAVMARAGTVLMFVLFGVVGFLIGTFFAYFTRRPKGEPGAVGNEGHHGAD